MDIKSASFVVSNSDYKKCPETGMPEFAFIGRSNVGKSSLINMLTGVKGLAKTSSKPGKTQLINHFLVNGQWYIVDLPGYGYAQSSKNNREKWYKMISDYILNRQTLVNLYVLIDSRIPPQRIDLEFISFMGRHEVPLSIIFTKTDKEKQREIMKNIKAFKQELQQEWEELPNMFLTSSVSGRGRNHVLDHIETIINSL